MIEQLCICTDCDKIVKYRELYFDRCWKCYNEALIQWVSSIREKAAKQGEEDE